VDADHGKDKEKFWKRVGGWFKSTKTDNYDESYISHSTMGTYDAEPVDASDTMIPSTTETASPSMKSRLSRSSAGMERLEQEYNRVVGLVESIQEHLGQSAERTQAMTNSIDRLAAKLEHLPETSRSQLEVLESLREEVAAEAQRAINVEQAVSQLPRLADAQREAMVSISHRMEESKVTDEKLSETLSGVRQSLEQVGQATQTSASTISMMRNEELERQDKIAKLLQQQTDRITWIASAALALAAIAMILGLISLFRS